MEVRIETLGVPIVFYNTETKKYSCVCTVNVNGMDKTVTLGG